MGLGGSGPRGHFGAVDSGIGSGGGLTPAQAAQLAALPGPWNIVSIGGDTNSKAIFTGRSGDADISYEVEFVGAAATDDATVFTLQVDTGGGPSTAGEDNLRIFGNSVGATAADAPPQFVVCDVSSGGFGIGQNPNFMVRLDALRTGLPRMFRLWNCRGESVHGAAFLGAGQYAAAGNIIGLTLISSTAAGIKGGSLLRWRRVGN